MNAITGNVFFRVTLNLTINVNFWLIYVNLQFPTNIVALIVHHDISTAGRGQHAAVRHAAHTNSSGHMSEPALLVIRRFQT